MNVGDIVTCVLNRKWIIYDFVFVNGQTMVAITDFETQKQNEVLSMDHIMDCSAKPANFQWLFILRREKNLKGLEKYI
jgi:hypothetical protein